MTDKKAILDEVHNLPSGECHTARERLHRYMDKHPETTITYSVGCNSAEHWERVTEKMTEMFNDMNGRSYALGHADGLCEGEKRSRDIDVRALRMQAEEIVKLKKRSAEEFAESNRWENEYFNSRKQLDQYADEISYLKDLVKNLQEEKRLGPVFQTKAQYEEEKRRQNEREMLNNLTENLNQRILKLESENTELSGDIINTRRALEKYQNSTSCLEKQVRDLSSENRDLTSVNQRLCNVYTQAQTLLESVWVKHEQHEHEQHEHEQAKTGAVLSQKDAS